MSDTLRQLLSLLPLQAESAEELLRALPDDKFKVAIRTVASLFAEMKKEAIRRGLWDELTRKD